MLSPVSAAPQAQVEVTQRRLHCQGYEAVVRHRAKHLNCLRANRKMNTWALRS